MKSITVGKHNIGLSNPPFIIAEMSGNHNHSLNRALDIVDAAATAGCHAFKIQTYTADTMTIKCNNDDFLIRSKKNNWFQYNNLYKLYQTAYTPWEWHDPIFRRCQELGMIGFSTAFDEQSVDFLESLNVPLYKIASFENTDLPLIKKIASTGKPIIISSGMANVSEIFESTNTAREAGCEDLVVLKCTSSYPASPKDSNLLTIPHLQKLLNVLIGLSDHTLGIGVAIASVSLGARVIEKHFTLSRSEGGVDSEFSLEPLEMKMLVEEAERAYQSLGKIFYGISDDEKNNICYRRSVYAVEDIEKGEKLTIKNVRRIRPGYGLPPKFYEIVVGRKALYNIKCGTPITWSCIE